MSRVGDDEFESVSYLRAQTDRAGRTDVLDDIGHQLINDQDQRNSHVGRHIQALDIGLDSVRRTTISSADFDTDR